MRLPGYFAVTCMELVLSMLGSPRLVWGDAFTFYRGVYTLYPNAQFTAINDAGVILGYNTPPDVFAISNSSEIIPGPFWVKDGIEVALPSSFQNAPITYVGVNDSGEAVANAISRRGEEALLFSDGVLTRFEFPGATATTMTGINEAGDIVGNWQGDAEWGFVYANGSFSSFAYPGSSTTAIFGISNNGLITGAYFTQTPNSVEHAYLYQDGTFLNIDVPYSTFTLPQGVNSSGEVVGYYTPGPTPEPASLVLVALGFATLALGAGLRQFRTRLVG